jgi:hypothetical protein
MSQFAAMAGKTISKKEFEAMLKPELVKHAQELGIETKNLSKEQLVKALVDFVSVSETGVGENVGLNATKPVVEATAQSVGGVENVEIVKLQWQMKQMEHEFRMRKLEADKEQAAILLEKHERDKKRDQEDKQRELEKDERDKQREQEDKQREREKDERDKHREHDFKMAQLQMQAEHGLPIENNNRATPQFRVDSAAKLLPKLVSEQETETFLITFEKIANLNKWPKENWAAVLQTQIKGKGLKVFSELSLEECKDYEKLKKAILTAYELCPEVYRKRFRASRKLSTETHADFAFKLTQSFKRWLIGVKSWDDLELLKETFLKEQFMESVPTDLKLWLTDRDPKSLEEMSKLADQFVTLRKSISPAEQSQDSQENMLVSSRPFVKSTKPWIKPKVTANVDKVVDTSSEKRDKFNNKVDLSQVRCFYCQKSGHKIAQCRSKQQNEAKDVKKCRS